MGYAMGRILLVALFLGFLVCGVLFIVNAPAWALYFLGASICFAVWNELA